MRRIEIYIKYWHLYFHCCITYVSDYVFYSFYKVYEFWKKKFNIFSKVCLILWDFNWYCTTFFFFIMRCACVLENRKFWIQKMLMLTLIRSRLSARFYGQIFSGFKKWSSSRIREFGLILIAITVVVLVCIMCIIWILEWNFCVQAARVWDTINSEAEVPIKNPQESRNTKNPISVMRTRRNFHTNFLHFRIETSNNCTCIV
jgi:hypothetical protein